MKFDFSLIKDLLISKNFLKTNAEISLELLKVFGVVFLSIFAFGVLLFLLKNKLASEKAKKPFYAKFYWAFWTLAILGGVWSLLGYQKVPFLSSGIALILIFALFIYKILKALYRILKVYPKEHEKKKEFERKLKYLRSK